MFSLRRLIARKPSPSEAASVLSELACLSGRERIRARCRIMEAQMGRPPSPVFEPRN